MKKTNWYPLAISALVIGCGGTTEDNHGSNTGGSSSIDSGVPTNTGGIPANYYGVRTDTGGATTFNVASGGGSSVDFGFGGAVAMYGPKFDQPMQSSVSSGGSPNCVPSNAEGGALQAPLGSKCVSRELG